MDGLKVKVFLTDPAMGSYTGPLQGGYSFVNGVSEEEIPIRNALRIGATMGCKTEDGKSLNPADWHWDENLAMVQPPIEVYRPNYVPDPAEQDEYEIVTNEDGKYTERMLEKVADKEGIGGLRKIAEEFDVKSTSIAVLIRKIVNAQRGEKGKK